MKNFLYISIAILLTATYAKPASADLILGGQLYYTGGDVNVRVLDASAAYHSYLGLYLLDPTTLNGEEISENHMTGHQVVLTAADMNGLGYSIGDELIFGIDVFRSGGHFSPGSNSHVFVMGAGDRNPDGLMHAVLDTDGPQGGYIVGFEDIFGGGDRDYNDSRFSFTGGINQVPEPGVLLLMGIGLISLAARRRRKLALS